MTYYTHDALARETRRDYPDARHAYFEYAVCGRRTAMQDATGRYEWAHDAAGRLTRYTQLDDEHSYYEYDASGRRTKYIDPNGDDTLFDYDGAIPGTPYLIPSGEWACVARSGHGWTRGSSRKKRRAARPARTDSVAL